MSIPIWKRMSCFLDVHSSRDIVVCRLWAALSVSEPWEPCEITNVRSFREKTQCGFVPQTSTLNFHWPRAASRIQETNGKRALMRAILQKSRSRKRGWWPALNNAHVLHERKKWNVSREIKSTAKVPYRMYINMRARVCVCNRTFCKLKLIEFEIRISNN